MPDDYSASTSTTGTVAVGGSVTGTIETARERDWIAVELVAGHTYRFDLQGAPSGHGTLSDTFLRRILDAEGNKSTGDGENRTYNDDFGASRDSRVTFTATVTGTYYVEVSGDRDETGTYTLSVADLTPEPSPASGTADTARAAAEDLGDITALNGPRFPRGTLEGEAGERDWFTFTLTEAKAVGLGLRQQDANADFFLEDAEGNVLHSSTLSGTTSEALDVTLLAGTYYVRVDAQEAGRNDYVFRYGVSAPDAEEVARLEAEREAAEQVAPQSVSEPAGEDLPADLATSGRVLVGETVTGRIGDVGDRDWFAVELVAGKRYAIDLKGVWTHTATLYDPHLYGIHDANGDLIPGTEDGDGGAVLNSLVHFKAPADGIYYIAAGYDDVSVYGSDHSYGTDGTYELSVSEVADDYAADTGTTGTVAVGSSATGEIEFPGERDWFAVELEKGETYRFHLQGASTEGETLDYPFLYGIHDADGNLIPGTSDDTADSGRDNLVFRLQAPVDGVVHFQAPADGTYYVAVGGADSTDRGAYTLSATSLLGAGDDYVGSIRTSGIAEVGVPTTAEIERRGDRDWFAVTLEAGKVYKVELKGVNSGNGTLWNPYLLGIHDADGNLVPGTTDDNGGHITDSLVYFEPTVAGTYYVAARGVRGNEGTYTVLVSEVPDDFSSDSGTAGTLAVGSSVTGEVELDGDRDWFAVELQAGYTYRFDLEGEDTGKGTLADPRLYGIYDANGDLIPGTTDGDGGVVRNSLVQFEAPADGTYYVAAGGSGPGAGTYTLSAIQLPPDIAADTSTAGTVAVGGSVRGVIETPGDRDWFAVELVAGKLYAVGLKGTWTQDGTLFDPYLHGIHDADGNPIPGTSNDDGGYGLNSLVYVEAPADGTYYIAAGYDTPRPGSNYGIYGTYELAVSEIADDYAADTGTTGTVAVGGSATGDIDIPADGDWFAVTLEADKTYKFELKGALSGNGTLRDPYLRGIHDADGNLIPGTTNNDTGSGGFDSRVYFTPIEDGTYYVAAGSAGGHMGTYTVLVAEVPDDYAADTGTRGTVAAGGSVTGEVKVDGDRDWFAVELEVGHTYRIDLEGMYTGKGTLRDPYLHGIHDADGNPIPGTTNDDSGYGGSNSRVLFTPTADGTYYVAAGADGSRTGTYTLSVTSLLGAGDDYVASTRTSGSVAVGGSVTGEVERREDRDWFAVTLEAGKTYQIDLKGRISDDGTLMNPYIHGIHDGEGNLLPGTVNDNGIRTGANSQVYFRPETDGTYYVAAGGDGEVFGGTYTLSVSEARDDYVANTQTEGTVAVGDSATGEIERPGDRDWFAVELVAGKTYRIDLEGRSTDKGTLTQPFLHWIRDADGNGVPGTSHADRAANSLGTLTFRPEAGGTYYVEAGSWFSHPDHLGTYTLSVTDVTPKLDVAADTGTIGTVSVGSSVSSAIGYAGDNDWFAVELLAGKKYRFDLEGLWTDKGTLRDPYLRGIHDATGALIDGTTDDDGGTRYNSQMTFTPVTDGAYYVAAGAYRDRTGSYTLAVEEVVDAI